MKSTNIGNVDSPRGWKMSIWFNCYSSQNKANSMSVSVCYFDVEVLVVGSDKQIILTLHTAEKVTVIPNG